ncbi:MAG: extracellular solute-binding protein [Caldilineaceae bacterium SB0662_bin_9]|uniref:Maltodextrin-binding protein n=1 Tax=Caldilineaceae bacterium SB0662_bin_9 TaxID=2605258 RepID=A0A6B1DSY0_9CHLR|nr:extracellular solute-binding protein [Caldilineaceae bacterium SB0662_bin_9]
MSAARGTTSKTLVRRLLEALSNSIQPTAMFHRHHIRCLLPVLMAVVLFVLAACGPIIPPPIQPEAAEPEPVEAAEEAPATDMADVEVPALVIWSDEARVPALQAMGDRFAEDFGVEVAVVGKPLSDILADYKVALGAGSTEPDILFGGSDWLGLLASNEVIAPIDLTPWQDHFGAGVLRSMSYEGVQYGVPVTADSLALFYNTDLVAEVPATWGGTADVAYGLMQEGSVELGIAVNSYSPFDIYPVVTGRGGDLFAWNADTGFDVESPLLGSQATVDAILFLQSLGGAGVTNPTLAGAELERLVNEGRVPFMVSGPWNLDRVRQSPVNWSVAAFPDGGSSFVNVLGYMLNARGPDPLFAWHFLQSQVLTDGGMEALQAAAPGIPAWLPILDGLDDPMMAQMGRIAAQGRAVPTIPEMPEVWKVWGEAQFAVVGEGADAQAAYITAGSKLDDILALRLAAQQTSE